MYSRLARHPLVLAAIFAAYLVLGRLGQFRLPPFDTPPIWPASGLALAAFLLFGRGIWPAVALGSAVVRYWGSADVISAILIGTGNTLEGLVGAAMITRFAGGANVFDKPETIFRFAASAIAASLIGATFGALTLFATGARALADVPLLWRTWWLGHLTGCLVMTPFVLLWATTKQVRVSMMEVLEAISLLGGLVFVCSIVFAGAFPTHIKNYPLEFLCVPFFLWAAFRFGQREVASAMTLLSGMAVWGTLHGFGPFVRDTSGESLVLLQAYASVMAVMVTVLAATVAGRKHAEAKLHQLALTDPLTGLSNYRRLIDVLRAEIARSNRTRRPFTVLMLDMNGLKKINDQYGHLVGSRALCRLAETLRRACRTIDVAARFGGDEFAIVLPETAADGGQVVLQRIVDELAADIGTPKVSVGGGIAVFPEDGDNPTMLLRAADAALYTAKTKHKKAAKVKAEQQGTAKLF